jgi:hypothetical protein
MGSSRIASIVPRHEFIVAASTDFFERVSDQAEGERSSIGTLALCDPLKLVRVSADDNDR